MSSNDKDLNELFAQVFPKCLSGLEQRNENLLKVVILRFNRHFNIVLKMYVVFGIRWYNTLKEHTYPKMILI